MAKSILICDDAAFMRMMIKDILTKNGYEESNTERICFSSDPGKCLTALSQNCKGKSYNVYEPDSSALKNLYKPKLTAVPDAGITDEYWVTAPTKIRKVGSIYVTGDDGKDGMQYKYGNNTAELYGWNYEWK